jgi:hypothetical protein
VTDREEIELIDEVQRMTAQLGEVCRNLIVAERERVLTLLEFHRPQGDEDVATFCRLIREGKL